MEKKFWKDLNKKQREQVTETYKAIRSVEEEIPEKEVDASGVELCTFEVETDGYVSVII